MRLWITPDKVTAYPETEKGGLVLGVLTTDLSPDEVLVRWERYNGPIPRLGYRTEDEGLYTVLFYVLPPQELDDDLDDDPAYAEAREPNVSESIFALEVVAPWGRRRLLLNDDLMCPTIEVRGVEICMPGDLQDGFEPDVRKEIEGP